MLSYWLPTPLSMWWPLGFAIALAILAVIAVFVTLARRREEQDAPLIATLYGVGLGLAAVTEFMMFLDIAYKWSLAATFAMSASAVTFFAVVAAVVAVIALIIALALQFREESTYRSTHGYAH